MSYIRSTILSFYYISPVHVLVVLLGLSLASSAESWIMRACWRTRRKLDRAECDTIRKMQYYTDNILKGNEYHLRMIIILKKSYDSKKHYVRLKPSWASQHKILERATIDTIAKK